MKHRSLRFGPKMMISVAVTLLLSLGTQNQQPVQAVNVHQQIDSDQLNNMDAERHHHQSHSHYQPPKMENIQLNSNNKRLQKSFNFVVDADSYAVALDEPLTLTRLNGDQTVTVPDDSIKAVKLNEPLRLAHATAAEPMVPMAAGRSISQPLEPAKPMDAVKIDAPLEALAKSAPVAAVPAKPKFAFDFAPTNYREPIAPVAGGAIVESPLEDLAKKIPTAPTPVAQAPAAVKFDSPLEEVAKKAPAPAVPAVAKAGVVTKVSADGKEKVEEDNESVTTTKKVEKPQNQDTTVTVDEDESDEEVIDKIEKRAGKKLNPREKKKAAAVIKMKKKIIKMKRIDPDSLDEDSTKEPEVSIDSKGSVSLKPKETIEDKVEKASQEMKPTTPIAPVVAPLQPLVAPLPPLVAPQPINKATGPPVAQNATHEVIPVVEEETKEVTTKDPSTGQEKKEVIKVPVTKNKVVPKAVTIPAVQPAISSDPLPTKIDVNGEENEAKQEKKDAGDSIKIAKSEVTAAKAEVKSAKPEEKAKKEEEVAKAEKSQAKAEQKEAQAEVKEAKIQEKNAIAPAEKAEKQEKVKKAQQKEVKAESEEAKAEVNIAKKEEEMAKPEEKKAKSEEVKKAQAKEKTVKAKEPKDASETCEDDTSEPVDSSKPLDASKTPCAACSAKKAADKAAKEKARKEAEGKTPCVRCAKKKAEEAAAKAKAKAEYEWNHPCESCAKDKKDKEELSVPASVNATHQAVPITEDEEKEVIVKDEKTGKDETVKVKVPVTKTKIVPKVAPVAQNSTHEVIPVTEMEEKEVPMPDAKSGKIKMVIEKVPVTKNKVIPKPIEKVVASAIPAATAPLAAPTPLAAPVAQNATHEVVPVVEEEEKEVTTKDSTTGEEKKEIIKVPVTKNKVIKKPAAAAVAPIVTPIAAPVAQNSTHEVVPVVEEESKVVTTKDTVTGQEKQEIVKVPVTKNKVIKKPAAAAVAPVITPIAAPVAQNSTHEVVPVVEEEEKIVTTKDPLSGQDKSEIVKVPVTKNKVVAKASIASPAVAPLETLPVAAPLETLPAAAPLETLPAAAPSIAPVAQNSTHEVIPVTEIEEKEEKVIEPTTGATKIKIVKVPVVKNKVVVKPQSVPAPVAQNSTHEVTTEVEEEEQEVTKTNKKTGEVKKVIVKVPVAKKVVKPKGGNVESDDPQDQKKADYLDDLESNLKEAFSKIHKQKTQLKIKKAEKKEGKALSNKQKNTAINDAADEAQKVIEEQEMKEAKKSLENVETSGKATPPAQQDDDTYANHAHKDEDTDLDEDLLKPHKMTDHYDLNQGHSILKKVKQGAVQKMQTEMTKTFLNKDMFNFKSQSDQLSNSHAQKTQSLDIAQMDNIDQIPTADSRSKATSLKSLMQVSSSYNQVLGQINQEVDDFSTSLNTNHLYQAIFLQGEINDNKDLTQVGFKAPSIQVHTVDSFKKAFTFPQIALNDYAVSQLDNLKEREQLLNKELALTNNKQDLSNFVTFAQQTAKNLKHKYQNQWVNPNNELIKETETVATEAPVSESVEEQSEQLVEKKTEEKIPQSIGQVLKKTQSAQAKLDDILNSVTGNQKDDGLNTFKEITDSILQSKTETYNDSGIEEIEMPLIKEQVSMPSD